jgi:hypothetical protein
MVMAHRNDDMQRAQEGARQRSQPRPLRNRAGNFAGLACHEQGERDPDRRVERDSHLAS